MSAPLPPTPAFPPSWGPVDRVGTWAPALLQGAVSLWLQKLSSRSAVLNTYCAQFAVQCAWSKEEGATRPWCQGRTVSGVGVGPPKASCGSGSTCGVG